jgi:hypothetical protein
MPMRAGNSADARRKADERLDRELENTFPASDAPSIVQPHEVAAEAPQSTGRAPKKA